MDLRWMFIDMNSFFASCEQQENPELRGHPVAVAPWDTDHTCCIAASYEAKAYGIRTGTNVGVARRLCPHLIVIHGRHEMYSEYNRQILRLLRSILPHVHKLSVDEVACRITPEVAKTEAEALKVALQIKAEMRRQIGAYLRCSIGLAPNVFLAKVATNLQKPNGLVVLNKSNLPDALYGLELSDLPGIGRRMLVRLHRCGIQSVAELCAAEPWLLRIAWGGVVGERWHYMLRGSADCDYSAMLEHDTKTVGHSHVLPPELRNPVGAEGVLLRLTARAVRRLRLKGYYARTIQIYVRHAGAQPDDTSYWSEASVHRVPAADPFTLVAAARELWAARPEYVRERTPTQVGVTFSELVASAAVTLPLFDRERRNEEAARAMDSICARFGKEVLEVGSVLLQREGIREAVAFGKVTDDDREEMEQSAFELSKGIESRLEPGYKNLLRI